jgi:hypothetical protein
MLLIFADKRRKNQEGILISNRERNYLVAGWDVGSPKSHTYPQNPVITGIFAGIYVLKVNV